jgi:bifunctional non-homologous end joining protein LigD
VLSRSVGSRPLLRVDGEDRCRLPLEIRREELDAVVDGIDGVVFSQPIDAEGAVVFEKAVQLGLEGIVSKRLGGAYWSCRCRNWVKVKNPDFRKR